jgi:polyhydroxyalkanoate synthesis regulator phasin
MDMYGDTNNMTRWIKLISVALVAVLCAMAFGMSTANAQTAEPTQPPPQNAHLQLVRGLANALLTATEKATNLTQADIRTELGTGKTLADIIKAHGSDVATVEADAKNTILTNIKQAVTDGKLNQTQADRITQRLDQALDQLVNHQFPDAKDRRVQRLETAAFTILAKNTADAAKISQRDLLKEVHDGKTLAQIASEHNADPKLIVTTSVTQATDGINKLVKAGKIKEDQAKTLIANLPDSLTKLMNTVHPAGGGRNTQRNGGGTAPAPATEPAPEGTPGL